MWKEFTHEKPARRGWTVATLSLAFIGTVVLAKIMVDVRTSDSSMISERQSPPDWPISFILPSDHRWRLRQGRIGQADAEGSDGESVAFVGRGLTGGLGILLISFKVMSPGTSSEQVARVMFQEDLAGSEEIAMGPFTGRMAVKSSRSDGVRVLAAGCSAEGLGIGVAYVASALTGDEASTVRSVCESIAFKEWWDRR